jgi:hypothetical protein
LRQLPILEWNSWNPKDLGRRQIGELQLMLRENYVAMVPSVPVLGIVRKVGGHRQMARPQLKSFMYWRDMDLWTMPMESVIISGPVITL